MPYCFFLNIDNKKKEVNSLDSNNNSRNNNNVCFDDLFLSELADRHPVFFPTP